MYRNFEAERARRNVTYKYLADKLGLTVSTMSNKANGKQPLTFGEATLIKNILNDILPLDMPLEELFEEAE